MADNIFIVDAESTESASSHAKSDITLHCRMISDNSPVLLTMTDVDLADISTEIAATALAGGYEIVDALFTP